MAPTAVPRHAVQFYGSDPRLLTIRVGEYAHEGLRRGQGVVMVVAPEHREAFCYHLRVHGAEPEARLRDGQLVFVDAIEALARTMEDGGSDCRGLEDTIGAALRRAGEGRAGVRAFGELVGLMWRAGQRQAAVRVEGCWNRMLAASGCELLCAYPIDVLGGEFHPGVVDELLRAHTHVVPSGIHGDLEIAIDRAMYEVLGSGVVEVRRRIRSEARPAWPAMATAESSILWVRGNLPERAGEILERAARHYQALRHLP